MKYFLLFFSIYLQSELDLTLPEQPPAYIPPETEFLIHLGDYNEPPTKNQIIVYWTLNVLDVYTTIHALENCNICTEQNPMLPERPEVEELILQKAIVAGFVSNNSSKRYIKLINISLTYAVIKNYNYM